MPLLPIDRFGVPSMQTGFARDFGQALHPELRYGLAASYCRLGSGLQNAHDLIRNNKPLVQTTTLPVASTQQYDPLAGLGMTCNTINDTYYAETDGDYKDWSVRPMTVFVRAYMDNWGGGGDECFASVRTGGTATMQWIMYHETDNTISFQVRQANGQTRSQNTASAASLTGWQSIIGTWRNSEHIRVFVPELDDKSGSATAAMQSVNTAINIGRRSGSAGTILDGSVSVLHMYEVVMPDNLLWQLHRDPLAPLRSKRHYLPIAAAAPPVQVSKPSMVLVG
jgi:hypothetical protein